MYVSCNNEVHLCNHCCSRRALSITYSKSVFVALGVQHAMHTLHNVICNLSSFTIFFHIISSMAQCFSVGGVTEIKCVFRTSLQLFYETFLILMRNVPDMIKNVYCFQEMYSLFLSDLNETWIFSADFPNKKFMKGCHVGAESFQADRHDARNSHFSQF